jgi:non-canonical (house-cleaning) NTP pyrophosphatase
MKEMGTSGWFECPPKILEQLKYTRELGDVMEDVTGEKRDQNTGRGYRHLHQKNSAEKRPI